MSTFLLQEEKWSIHNYWELYENPKEKKYKLMSPAILFWKFSNVYAVSNYLIASKEDIKFLKIGDADIQWPALDANGNPIQYRVEVEE